MLKFWELSPSPNNVKVRLGLRYKGIDFEVVPVEAGDRGPVLEASGQELTPVIEDRGVVLNDSEAILQYLDANYRETPRVFPADRAGRKACEAWKAKLDEVAIGSWLPVFLTAIGLRESFEASATEGFTRWLGEMDDALADADRFGTPDQPINDLRVAEWACYALPGPELIRRSPMFARFKDLFGVDAGSFPRLEAFLEPWNARLA